MFDIHLQGLSFDGQEIFTIFGGTVQSFYFLAVLG